MRPSPIYNRNKNVRSWVKDDKLLVESYFEDAAHFIILSLTLDIESLVIAALNVNFIRMPYPEICPISKDIYQKIIGFKVTSGFNKRVREVISNKKGCVHITTLLREAGDAVAQTGYSLQLKKKNSVGKERRKRLMDSLKDVCLAYSDEYN